MATPTTDYSFDVSEDEFEHKVLAASRERPVVVDFWAPWCRPCTMLGPVLERAVASRGGAVVLAKVDIDQAKNIAVRYRIDSIPAVIAFKAGRPVREFVGVIPEQQVNAFLDLLNPSESDRLVQQAGELSATDPSGAEHLFRQALERDPRNDHARIGLAELLVKQNKLDGVSELLDALTPGGPEAERAQQLTAETVLRQNSASFGDVADARARLVAEPESARRRYELGCALAVEGNYPVALEELLAAGESDPGLAAGPVREAMVQVFHLIGDENPLANDYRARLSRLLY